MAPEAGDHEQLDNHAEVVMHDFAACLLAEVRAGQLCRADSARFAAARLVAPLKLHPVLPPPLTQLERWMLNASPAMVDLNTFVDAPEFTGAPSALETVQTRLYSDEASEGQHLRQRFVFSSCLRARAQLCTMRRH